MSAVVEAFEWVADVVIDIVEGIVSLVEIVIEAVSVILFGPDDTIQIVEYYEVRNVPLFANPDNKDALVNSILLSVLGNKDVTGNLLYHTAFRSLKGNVREFMRFIEQGNYFEGFPTLESHIATIDYTELTAALATLNGVPCTPEGSYLRGLSKKDWVKYWLQEYKEYNVGTNTLGVDYSTTNTNPPTPVGDIVHIIPSVNHYDINITSTIGTSDEVFADERWQVNLNTISYNSTPDTYTIQVYNATNVGNITRTLSYTAPTKPTQLHYVSTYYKDSTPSRKYLFIYQVGSGVYIDLDTVESPIDIDGTVIQGIPAVPLRITNANYTTFGASKKASIESLLNIINIEANAVLNLILTDSGLAAGDIDNVYVNFGIRMWDTSEVGMAYLFKMFENLYPAQGHTQGSYNNTPTGDDKPQNNIITTSADSKYVFQWSYITYAHTPLATINANSGSTENGIYYSNMSKFDSSNILKYNYHVSSGKGTYNVGYKADDLSEVQDFLDGNGVINPGTTTTEAANWLQVTTRMSYNNPTPNLLESDNSAATLKFLTADLVYENNGSGVLRVVQAAAEATTVGQSITYYQCKPSGLDAYTVVAPIALLRVVDGATGIGRIVKFNLANKGDLILPFFYTFVQDFSNAQLGKLFLAGAHVSIYIAHYEVIVHAGMSLLTAWIIVITVLVIILICIFFPPAGGWATWFTETLLAEVIVAAGVGGVGAIFSVLFAALPGLLIDYAVQHLIRVIITELVPDDQMLAMLLNIVAMAAVSGWEGGELGYELNPDYSINWEAGLNTEVLTSFNYKSLSDFTALDYARVAVKGISAGNTILVHKTRNARDDLKREMEIRKNQQLDKWNALKKEQEALEPTEGLTELAFKFANPAATMGCENFYSGFTYQYDLIYMCTDNSAIIAQQVSGEGNNPYV